MVVTPATQYLQQQALNKDINNLRALLILRSEEETLRYAFALRQRELRELSDAVDAELQVKVRRAAWQGGDAVGVPPISVPTSARPVLSLEEQLKADKRMAEFVDQVANCFKDMAANMPSYTAAIAKVLPASVTNPDTTAQALASAVQNMLMPEQAQSFTGRVIHHYVAMEQYPDTLSDELLADATWATFTVNPELSPEAAKFPMPEPKPQVLPEKQETLPVPVPQPAKEKEAVASPVFTKQPEPARDSSLQAALYAALLESYLQQLQQELEAQYMAALLRQGAVQAAFGVFAPDMSARLYPLFQKSPYFAKPMSRDAYVGHQRFFSKAGQYASHHPVGVYHQPR